MNEILDNLRTIMQTAFGGAFKVYHKGRIRLVAQDDYPALMVYALGTKQSHHGTVRDRVEYRMAVEVRLTLKEYLNNAAGDGTQLNAEDALVDLVEKRDANGDLMATSIMGIINANLSIGGRVLYTDLMDVTYAETYLEASKFPGVKAIVAFTAFDRPTR